MRLPLFTYNIKICRISYPLSFYVVAMIFFGLLSIDLHAHESHVHTDQNHRRIEFKNFDQSISLIEDGDYFQVKGRELKVMLSDNLIVKTTAHMSPQELSKVDKLISGVIPLFNGTDFNYYRVTIKRNIALGRLITSMQKQDNILLVQPDILQVLRSAQLPKRNGKQSSLSNVARYYSAIGVDELHKNTHGSGVKIAVIDDGFALNHPLLAHIKPVFSYDLYSQTTETTSAAAKGMHGTKVAGILFAKPNKKVIGGLASDAHFIALSHVDTWTSKTLLTFQLANLEKADVINCSWNSPWLLEPVADVVNDLASHGRDGKGTAVVFAAGNEGQNIAVNSIEASISSAIVVGAVDLESRRLDISNYGPSIDVMSFGGPVRTTYIDEKYSDFGGTSLSAAIVSGVAALILSQQPQLSLAQLKVELEQRFTLNGTR